MQIIDTVANCSGRLYLEVYKSGALINKDTGDNLVVNIGRSTLAGLLGGRDAGKFITHIGVGSGMTPTNDTDTALAQQTLVGIDGVVYSGNVVRFNFTLGYGNANGIAIREYGLFFTDGTLFSRRVRNSVISKESDIEIKGYWEIRF